MGGLIGYKRFESLIFIDSLLTLLLAIFYLVLTLKNIELKNFCFVCLTATIGGVGFILRTIGITFISNETNPGDTILDFEIATLIIRCIALASYGPPHR